MNRTPLSRLLAGALAGFLATVPMTAAMWIMHRFIVWKWGFRDDRRVTARSFRRGELVFEDNLYAPDLITGANVVAHAIEHLALLARRDPPIGSTLDEAWKAFLADQLPQPARELADGT